MAEKENLVLAARAVALSSTYGDKRAMRDMRCSAAELSGWIAEYLAGSRPELCEAVWLESGRLSAAGHTAERANVAAVKLLDAIGDMAGDAEFDPDRAGGLARCLEACTRAYRAATESNDLEPFRRREITRQLELDIEVSAE